jgi:hypothetical protein
MSTSIDPCTLEQLERYSLIGMLPADTLGAVRDVLAALSHHMASEHPSEISGAVQEGLATILTLARSALDFEIHRDEERREGQAAA